MYLLIVWLVFVGGVGVGCVKRYMGGILCGSIIVGYVRVLIFGYVVLLGVRGLSMILVCYMVV